MKINPLNAELNPIYHLLALLGAHLIFHVSRIRVKEKTVLVYTDSQIMLQLLQNQKKHTHRIELIRTKFIEMEMQDWKVECSWIRAHVGHHGNKLADRLAKEAANTKNIDECYNRIPKSAMLFELNEQSVIHWQSEWDQLSKGAITKSFFPKIADRLKLRINPTPKFTAIVTGHGDIKTYLLLGLWFANTLKFRWPGIIILTLVYTAIMDIVQFKFLGYTD